MLDINTAKIVKKSIDDKFDGNGPLTLEDVVHMELIPKSERGLSCNILASQYGDLTILALVHFSEKSGVSVREVETLAW